ncbi:hypothetical protein KGF56_004521 [Candida oxycetoniae]|uniref:CFEM domain-containing protein n=1 Tax=Candida oxycetoniae TaxID=497107 RepID=A0AAI9STI4_9ASCO|nr:uncharacterized protein KGF56_004521 [Candida oxycetoniae]KAI3402640.1 hypothetical protein KGF56_004521 [Candida oxycetoniae]
MLLISFITFIYYFYSVQADNYATYPKVPKTASINGFADPIIDLLPDCAKECVKFSTSNTPCPYWDTGCFCVMPQWSGLVGQCIAQNCKGDDVASATFLATSLCSTVGANTWMMPASISTMLSTAAGDAKEVTTISGKTAVEWVTAPGDTVSSSDGSGSATSSAATSSSTGSESAASGSSSSATTNTSSTSNMGILQTGSVASVILGFLLSFLI